MPVNPTLPTVTPGVDQWGATLNAAVEAVAAHSNSNETALAGKAATSHAHVQADVTGLAAALAAKADSSSLGTSATRNVGTTTGTVAAGDDARLSDPRTPTAHAHPQSDVTGLTAALAGKAASVHTHATADVTGLDTALAGKAATGHTHPVGYQFTYLGALAVTTGTPQGRIYNRSGLTRTISAVHVSVETAPTGADLIVDILKNGSSIFTIPGRPTITAGGNTGTAVPNTAAWADGEYLQVEVVQVGSTVAGAYLVGEVVAQ